VPRALITGVTGQDGMYLAKFLAAKGYEIFGLIHGQNNPRIPAVRRVAPSIHLLDGDLLDLHSLIRALETSQPDEVYNLGAISFVGMSWRQAEITSEVTAMGVLRILEAIQVHTHNDMSKVRFYQASSSEMFGNVHEVPQRETTAFHPRSPYGVAKTFGHYMTVNYRESYGAHACSGILFNHESPRRGHEFVTRKVTRGAARVALGLQKRLTLGNLEARRDWGFAGDYVEAMWLILQEDKADDYVIATGETHSIRDLLDIAFSRVGIEDWTRYVVQDARLFRPADVNLLVGDASHARARLGWKPRVKFRDLIEMMVDDDLADLQR
jgi:GDPmannose 4,6-dehydratase